MDGTSGAISNVEENDIESALAVLEALDAPFAVIEFTHDGKILDANENFLKAMGFGAVSEIAGKHHSHFLFREDAEAPEYQSFWSRLAEGNFHSSEVRRRTHSGAEIWLSANYVPIKDRSGNVSRVRKYALDITERHSAVELLVDALRQLASGNILVRLDDRVRGSFGFLKTEFNTLMDGLEGRMRKTMQCSENLKDVFETVSTVAVDLQEKARLQSDEVERTVASISEISNRTIENSEDAKTAGNLVAETVVKAEEGAQIMRDMREATGRMEEITKEVANITKVIDGFAFQTNLLSINAAVEAARAGDAGKGFAVVATEVRSLAQRSAEASKNIANLTRQSETEVTRGSEFARRAEAALEDIGQGVVQANEAVAKIADASQDQARAVTEIENAMRGFETSARSLTGLAENGRGAAESLSVELQNLAVQTHHFSTRESRDRGPSFGTTERRKANPAA